MGPGHFWLGGEIMFFIITMVIILVIVLAILRCAFWRRHFHPHWMDACHRHPFDHVGSETAIDILNKRYAKGEIKKEEFEQIAKSISLNFR